MEAEPVLPTDEKELEQLMQLLEGYQANSRQFAGDIPEELQELMATVKRAKGQQAPAQEKAQEITPQPGYVIKTTDQDDDRKVFINMCHSKQVPAPSCWADGMAPERVTRALEAHLHANQPSTDAEAMRFALSCSELQPDTDKQGQPCITVDCILNSDIMTAVQQHRPLKAFVNELAIDWVCQKHNLQLDPCYKLPKMAYKGTEVRAQRIRCDPKSLVTDVTPVQDSDNEQPSFPLLPNKAAAAAAAAAAARRQRPPAGSAAAAAGGSNAATQPPPSAAVAGSSSSSSGGSSWQHTIKCEGTPVSHMVVTLQLPCSSSSSSSSPVGSVVGSPLDWSTQDVAVQVCGMQLQVNLCQQQQQQPQQQLSCLVQLPFAASTEGAQAWFQRGTGQVMVKLSNLPVQAWVQQLAADAPHFVRLPVAHASYMELDE